MLVLVAFGEGGDFLLILALLDVHVLKVLRKKFLDLTDPFFHLLKLYSSLLIQFEGLRVVLEADDGGASGRLVL